MSPEYGELRPTSGWDRFISLGHPCKFQRLSRLGSVTARLSSSERPPNFAALWTEAATYVRQGENHVGHWPTFLVFVAIIWRCSWVILAELTNSLYGVFISIVLIPECNKVNVTTELLNVKYNFVTVSVLDLADIVFLVLRLCVLNLCLLFYVVWCTNVRFL